MERILKTLNFIISLFLTCSSNTFLYSQESISAPNLRGDIPTSPQAAAFVRLGEYKVNNQYGSPDISIPLFNIDCYGYKIPLTLRYEAQPLHPGYNYDVYGLGWMLSGNSCVIRTIKSQPDEYGDDNKKFRIEPNLHTYNFYDYKHKRSDYLDWINTELDTYKIILPTGRIIPFFMYYDKNLSGDGLKVDLLSIDKNVKVLCNTSNNTINSFTVIDEMGIKYVFDIAEKASNTFFNYNKAMANVSWLLSRIEIPGKEAIFYNYNNTIEINENQFREPILNITRLFQGIEKIDKNYFSFEDMIYCGYEPSNEQIVETHPQYDISIKQQQACNIYHIKLLKSISSNTGDYIQFSYSDDNRHIKAITRNVINKDNNQTFSQTYNFEINDQKLVKLTIGTKDPLVYKFDYTINRPGKETDHWGNWGESISPVDIGNFNVCVDNINVSEERMLKDYLKYTANHVILMDKKDGDIPQYFKLKLQSSLNGESRRSTPPDLHCVLSRIIYPNGGSTCFEFENHKFLTANSADGHLERDRTKQRIVEGGGFRIKNITNHDADGKMISMDEYLYGYTYDELGSIQIPFPVSATQDKKAHTGCGEAVVDPNVLTYMTYDYSTSTIPSGFREMITGCETDIAGFMYITNTRGLVKPWWWNARFSAINYRKLLEGRPAVVYPEITVIHKDTQSTCAILNKTVYNYNIYHNNDTSPYTYYLCNHENTPYTAYIESVKYDIKGTILMCDKHPEKYNQLASKTNYSYVGVAKDTYDWFKESSEEYTYYEYTKEKYDKEYNNAYAEAHCPFFKNHGLSISVGKDESFVHLSDFFSEVKDRMGSSKIASKKTKLFSRYTNSSNPDPITITEKYEYIYGDQIRKKIYYDIANKQDEYTYAGENQSEDATTKKMKQMNMLALPADASTIATSYMGQKKTAGYKIEYGIYGNNVYPNTLYEYNGKDMEKATEVVSYTEHGNPREVKDLKTGLHTTYLWGYNDRYMIAEIQGATYNEVKNYEGTLLSNPSISNLNNTLRSKFTNAMIQTWEYAPLKGVIAHTDVMGQTFKFYYDDLGRLIKETRFGSAEEIIKTYEYNFINN